MNQIHQYYDLRQVIELIKTGITFKDRLIIRKCNDLAIKPNIHILNIV